MTQEQIPVDVETEPFYLTEDKLYLTLLEWHIRWIERPDEFWTDDYIWNSTDEHAADGMAEDFIVYSIVHSDVEKPEFENYITKVFYLTTERLQEIFRLMWADIKSYGRESYDRSISFAVEDAQRGKARTSMDDYSMEEFMKLYVSLGYEVLYSKMEEKPLEPVRRSARLNTDKISIDNGSDTP